MLFTSKWYSLPISHPKNPPHSHLCTHTHTQSSTHSHNCIQEYLGYVPYKTHSLSTVHGVQRKHKNISQVFHVLHEFDEPKAERQTWPWTARTGLTTRWQRAPRLSVDVTDVVCPLFCFLPLEEGDLSCWRTFPIMGAMFFWKSFPLKRVFFLKGQ